MKLLITIDTEPDCDTHWYRSNPLTFSSVQQGIPDLLRPIFDKYNIKPIYFVSPEVLADNDSCRVLKNEIKSGAVIGAHLHSEYIEPAKKGGMAGKPSTEFPCLAHSKEIEYEKIKNLTELIKSKLNYAPVWYRAARFGADLDTMKSLVKLGYIYDSSITPRLNWAKIGGPDHSKSPQTPYWISREDYYKEAKNDQDKIGIKEYPITITGKRFGWFGRLLPNHWLFYNWLRPTHMTAFEQKRLIKKASAQNSDRTLVAMFHSMEIMVGKTPYVRSRLAQKLFLSRLEAIISEATHYNRQKR